MMSKDMGGLFVIVFSQLMVDLVTYTVGNKAVDIGHPCKSSEDCHAGNGGRYSKCNKKLSVCVCSITHLGQRICNYEKETFAHVCQRQKAYYEERDRCPVECTQSETRTWIENEDWYGIIEEPFASFVHDKMTVVCYDPARDVNSLPDGLIIKLSSIPDAGRGVFAEVYLEQGTVFGPYKGIVEPQSDDNIFHTYSWSVKPDEVRNGYYWIHGDSKATSNWMRYVNTPNATDQENILVIQYKGEMYYYAFKSIHPGTELLVSYGKTYLEYLGLEEYNQPVYYTAEPGYAGGACQWVDKSYVCQNDENTICADTVCFCVPGTHIRAGMCIKDETLGGICTGSNGETCIHDMNAECQRGVCVCKKNSTPANGECRADETYGGLCSGENGNECLLEKNTVCINGICRYELKHEEL